MGGNDFRTARWKVKWRQFLSRRFLPEHHCANNVFREVDDVDVLAAAAAAAATAAAAAASSCPIAGCLSLDELMVRELAKVVA